MAPQVTVVDGSSFMDELMAGGALKDRGWQAQPEDQRTIAQLFCDQVEFANVIVVNKCDLLDDGGRSQLHAFLKRANPKAKVVESTYGRVDPKQSYAVSLLRRWRGGRTQSPRLTLSRAGCSARTCSRYRKRSSIPIG